jgi:single-stranded DNA-specific DHH superfamily exonuclease
MLTKLAKGKNVFIGTHWDCDGVCSGALLYHLLKPHAKSIKTLSKGTVFEVNASDIKGEYDIIVISDIKPGNDLDFSKVAYIDHHPLFDGMKEEDFLFTVFDDNAQSCSLLIWQELIPQTDNPYFLFLTLLGYFGDGGKGDSLPAELTVRANDALKIQTRFGIHNLMERKMSAYGSGEYYEIERYVSALNTGKRMHWSGDVPLELLKSIDNFRPYIYKMHPLAEQLNGYREELRGLYSMKIKFKHAKHLQYSVIECDKNIQGVLCAKHMKDKPVMVINRHNGSAIASMRVPDHVEFDAGAFLNGFRDKIQSLVGGGHEKAGGVTMHIKELDKFIDLLDEM